jgi:hypothetical protein
MVVRIWRTQDSNAGDKLQCNFDEQSGHSHTQKSLPLVLPLLPMNSITRAHLKVHSNGSAMLYKRMPLARVRPPFRLGCCCKTQNIANPASKTFKFPPVAYPTVVFSSGGSGAALVMRSVLPTLRAPSKDHDY